MNIPLTIEQFDVVEKAINDSLLNDPPIDNIRLLENAQTILQTVKANHLMQLNANREEHLEMWVKNNIS